MLSCFANSGCEDCGVFIKVVTRVGVEDRAALWYSVLCLLISVCVYESYLY